MICDDYIKECLQEMEALAEAAGAVEYEPVGRIHPIYVDAILRLRTRLEFQCTMIRRALAGDPDHGVQAETMAAAWMAKARGTYSELRLAMDGKDFARNANEPRRLDAQKRHETWLAADRKLETERPTLRNKLDRARAIRRSLGETAAPDTIARQLPPRK